MTKKKKTLAAGIDVGGINTETGIVDQEGKILGALSFKTKDYPIFEDYIERIAQDIGSLLKNHPDKELSGIGIGAPCGNYFRGAAENPVNIAWYEREKGGAQGKRLELIPFVEIMKRHYPAAMVVVDNDANAAAIGEMIYGGAKGMKDFILITVGTGLGSGVIAGGQMVYGYEGTAGELGHVIVKRDGRKCGCGRNGCLETYVSATGITRTMLRLLADDKRPSKLRDYPVSQIDSRLICDAAREGDELAMEAFEFTGKVLGEALADFTAVTYPEAIFLFGGLAKSGKLLFEPTKRHMEANMLRNYKDKVKLLPSAIDAAGAAILGASALVWAELTRQEPARQ